jgi:hypothetical protein
VVRVGGRAAVSGLLVAAGVLSILGARERWWPACRLGAYETGACLQRQDSAYNYLTPIDGYRPVGHAAACAGVGLLVLAVASALVPWVLLRGRAVVLAGWSLVLAAPVAVFGVTTLMLAADPTPVDGGPGLLSAGVGWIFGWPVALVVLRLLARPATPAARWGWVVLVGALFLSTPFPQALFSLGLIGYSSYDTAPWTEATLGVCLLVAAVALWPAAGRSEAPAHRREVGDRLRVTDGSG